MSRVRVISIEGKSRLYHKAECRYARKILPQNYLEITKAEAQRQGYDSCRYCNCMKHHYLNEIQVISQYESEKKLQFRFVENILYVKTVLGLWKLVYLFKEEKIAIYHRNASQLAVDMESLENEKFHRQKDITYVTAIEEALQYICKHDTYKGAVERGEKNIQYSNKKYKAQAKKKERRKSIGRVNYLFTVLEEQRKK